MPIGLEEKNVNATTRIAEMEERRMYMLRSEFEMIALGLRKQNLQSK